MAPYIALILLPSFFALFSPRRISSLSWWGILTIYIVFIGLRYEVGPDWAQYIQIHYFSNQMDFWEVAVNSEPLSYMLFWISERSGLSVYLTNVVAAIVMIIGVQSFARNTCNPWLALLAASPYFIIVVGMSGIRQAMAAGVMLFLLSNWKNFSVIKRSAYIFGAALFHTSALVNSIFLITQLRLHLIYRFLFGIVIFLVTLYLSTSVSIFSDNVQRYEQRYIENPEGPGSLGSIFHIAMIAIPALLGFAFRRKINPFVQSPQLLTFGLYAALAVIFVNFFSSTAASRLTIYLYFIPMMVYPAFSMILGQRNAPFMTFCIILLHLFILVAWFLFANHTHAYTPYQNILFQW